MLLEIKNISKFFKKNLTRFVALDNISFSIEAPAILAILGPNGAGKTTLLKIISGIICPSQGETLLDGNVINFQNQQLIGFSPENPFFLKYLNAIELLELGLSLTGKKNNELITQILKQVDLFEERFTRIKLFSKGMLQRLSLAAAFIHNPAVLILDEPMSGLDPLGRKMVKNLLKSAYEQKKLIIFSSHNLEDVEMIATDLVLLQNGKIVLQNKMQNLREESSFLVEKEEAGVFSTAEAGSVQELITILNKSVNNAGSIIRINSNLAKRLERYYEKI